MSPEAQRIAIAEACGWKKGGLDCDGYQIWIHPSGARQYWAYVPDYLNDLNACHEMEKVLNSSQILPYLVMLQPHYFPTASQRCEAFLKTLGLWKDRKRLTLNSQPPIEPISFR